MRALRELALDENGSWRQEQARRPLSESSDEEQHN